jgi:hypothetical protein
MPGAKPGRNRWWRKYGRLESGPLKEFPSGLRHPPPGNKGFANRGIHFCKWAFNLAKINAMNRPGKQKMSSKIE